MENERGQSSKSNEAYQILSQMPDWTNIPNYSKRTGYALEKQEAQMLKQRVISDLQRLDVYDTAALRDAVVRLIAEDNGPSRVFVLNRFIFAVPDVPIYPDRSKKEIPYVPPWRQPNRCLWPLSYNPQGRLELTGWFHGYSGAPYQYLREFDNFAISLGRRKRS